MNRFLLLFLNGAILMCDQKREPMSHSTQTCYVPAGGAVVLLTSPMPVIIEVFNLV